VIPDLRAVVDAGHDAAVDLRRALHAHPELAGDEHATTAAVQERMLSHRWRELRAPASTGAVFELDTGNAGRSVLIRADIDALPVTEEVDVPWRSRVDGVMHACGHDAHAAILVAVARVLATRAENLPGRYVAVFQPAEETSEGARRMLEGGLLDVARADAACGIHVAAPLPTGSVGTRPGVFYAACQSFAVDFRGAGGHGALAGRDGSVVLAAAELASRLSEVVDGMEFEDVECACTAGSLHAGTAANVAPRTARVEGSIRTFTAAQAVDSVGRLEALCTALARGYGVTVTPQLFAPTSAVHNDPRATAVALRAAHGVLGEGNAFEMPPITPSDDMAEILARVPGVYLAVGARPGSGMPPQHHAPDFSIDEEVLRVGTLTLAATAVALAERPQTQT
jgi:amidohydrolase